MTTVEYQVSPRKPWRLGRKQLAVNGLVFFGSIAATPLLLDATPLAGKLGAAFIFVVIATLANVIVSVIRQGPRMVSNAISSSLIYLATALVLLPLGSILFTVMPMRRQMLSTSHLK